MAEERSTQVFRDNWSLTKSRLDEAQSSDSAYAEEVLVLKDQLRVDLVEEETFWGKKV